MKTSGVGVFDDLLEEGVLERRAPNALAIFWDVDAPATLDRLEHDGSDPLRILFDAQREREQRVRIELGVDGRDAVEVRILGRPAYRRGLVDA